MGGRLLRSLGPLADTARRALSMARSTSLVRDRYCVGQSQPRPARRVIAGEIVNPTSWRWGALPPLTIKGILMLIDAHRRQQGEYPNVYSARRYMVSSRPRPLTGSS